MNVHCCLPSMRGTINQHWWKNILLLILGIWHVGHSVFMMPTIYTENYISFLSPIKSNQGPFSICPHAKNLFPKVSNWTLILEEANDFYLRGGSFEANQAFLTKYISTTYKRMELPFVSLETNTTTWDAVTHLDEYYQQHPPKQGGYNQPLPGYFAGKNWKYLAFEKHLGGKAPGRRGINVLEPFKEERFEVAIGPMLFQNEQQCEIKEMDDKFFCDISEDKETSSPCHIFSIGSNDEWGYERQFAQYAPRCTIHTFDCTLTPRRMPKNNPNIVFHPYCLGSTTKSRNSNGNSQKSPMYRSYTDLIQLAKVPASPPKLLKMDIEGFEYSVLLDLLRTSPASTWPEQISMEVHWATRMVDLDWMLRTKTAAEMSIWFTALYAMAGYLPVARKFFPTGCPSCVELLLVRIVC